MWARHVLGWFGGPVTAEGARRPDAEMSLTRNSYLGDAPVVDPDLDRFRRRQFAERIADTLAARAEPASLVVGLYGRWGEGKTTVLRFIEKRLEAYEPVVCVRFNPWLYQGEPQLLLSFFETLAAAIGQSLKTKKEEMGRWLRNLGAALATVAMGAGIINTAPGSSRDGLGEALSSVEILEKRAQLEGLLRESGKTVLIMIDDIDRLDDDGIAIIFKLVKLAADFEHVSYILAFDHDVVARALSRRYADQEGSGSSFIEKIVQVPIELPRVDDGVLQSMTLDAMAQTLGAAGTDMDDSDISRFSTVFARDLAPYIVTPRMVKRIANVTEFVVPLVAGEVNVADLLLVETVHVLFPQVYKRMPLAKDALLGTSFDRATDSEELVRLRLEALLEGLDDMAAGHVMGALRELFPRIEQLFSNYHYGRESIPGWRSAQRICAPEYFDRFFSYGVPIGDLADTDLGAFLDQLHLRTTEAAISSLIALYEGSSPDRVVQKLRPLETTLDPAVAVALVRAIAATSDKLPDPVTGPLSGMVSPFLNAAMHVARLLHRVPSNERGLELGLLINASPSLAFAAEVFRWSHTLSGDDVPPAARVLTPDQIADLELALVDAIAGEAERMPLFVSMPRYAPGLYYDWLQVAGHQGVERHLIDACSDSVENCLALVRSFMPSSASLVTGLTAGSIERDSYDSIAGLIDPQVIVDVLAAAYPSTIGPELPMDTSDMDEAERTAFRLVQVHRAVRAQTDES